MTPDPIDEMLGAYALDALTPEERAIVDAYLPTSPSSQEEVTQLSAVADQLALTAIPRDPPPALRARLLDIVEREAAEWRSAQDAAHDSPRPLTGAASPTSPNPNSLQKSRFRRALGRFPAYAYGAGGALVAAAVILLVVLANRNGVTVTPHSGSAVAQVVDGVRLAGVHFTVDVRSDHTTAVHFQGLPDLPPGRAYELWLIPAHGKPVPVGGFVGNAGHAFTSTYTLDAARYAEAAVTIERAPGDASTPSPYLALAAKLS
ncbi:MAG TPA: anti-sigma factor [Chloroflexota bacterium]|nr:anti-sigma factor [Chloroflexota bacterium]